MTLVWQPGYTWNETVWNPAMVTSVGGWYDASKPNTVYDATSGGNPAATGSTVARLEDRSSNARHLQQTSTILRPTYTANGLNSLNTLTFNGDNVLYGPSVTIAQPFTVISVVKFDAYAQFDRVSVINGSSSAARLFADGASDLILGAGTDRLITGGAFPLGNWRLFEVVFNGASSYIRYSGGNSLAVAGSIGTGSFDVLNLFGYQGREPSGSMAESVICSSLLSTSDRQKLEGYFAHKWGLDASLPAGHPYKTTGPTP